MRDIKQIEYCYIYSIMVKYERQVINVNIRTYNAVLSKKSDYSININDFKNLIIDLGFVLRRKKSSHSMYYHYGVNAFMNVQKDGSKAKAYQVEQLRNIILKHNLGK